MTAHVGFSFNLTFKTEIIFFPEGESVHISPEKDCRTGPPAVDQSCNPGGIIGSYHLRLKSEVRQYFCYESCRNRKIKSGLRVAVDLPSP